MGAFVGVVGSPWVVVAVEACLSSLAFVEVVGNHQVVVSSKVVAWAFVEVVGNP